MTANFTPGMRIETITVGGMRAEARFSGYHITLYIWRGVDGRRRDLLARVPNNGVGWQAIERIIAGEEAEWLARLRSGNPAM
jgi:hypothetical protein